MFVFTWQKLRHYKWASMRPKKNVDVIIERQPTVPNGKLHWNDHVFFIG